ncbi:MAG: NADP-dependent oxidoreductase [Caulobacteraceae bacterium]|nr:NADP-dependent oxidoreductase [Caulobacter sp.]
MKCVRIHKFGGPDVLQVDELTQLVPEKGQFVIKVMAASVNPVDYKTRAGDFPMVKDKDLPVVLGRDGAGVVSAVGDGVDGVEVGDEVLVHLGFERGAYAEQAVVCEGEWAKVPEGVSMDAAGALPLAGDTAWQGLFDEGGLQAGQTVLIHGGSGGVGHLAVQFAKVKGARVITTCGKDAVDFVKSLGADEVIDYEKEKFEDHARDVDLVYDLIGGDTRQRSWAVLKPGGRLVTTVPDGQVEQQGRDAGREGKQYMAKPSAENLAEMAGLVADGKVRVHVDKTFPLDKAADAQKEVENEHPLGKVVIQPQG